MSSPQLNSAKNYTIEEIVDAGNFGAVYKVLVHEDQKRYAVKQINIEKYSESDRQNALNEAKIEYNLLKKGIPNVLKSFGSNYDSNKEIFRFSMELMEMNLAQYIKGKKNLSFEEFSPIFSDILTGIILFHKVKIYIYALKKKKI